jgi:hypothetical protein
MKTQFSLFDGFAGTEFPKPFDYWNDFINEQLDSFKSRSNLQIIQFHCCVIPENENIDEDEFLKGFFQKLPFTTINEEQNTIHFWLQTPELKMLLQNDSNTFDAEIMAQSLLDSMLKMFSVFLSSNLNFMNLVDIQTFINNSKKAISETSMLEIREKYRIKQENDFKNKYWI